MTAAPPPGQSFLPTVTPANVELLAALPGDGRRQVELEARRELGRVGAVELAVHRAVVRGGGGQHEGAAVGRARACRLKVRSARSCAAPFDRVGGGEVEQHAGGVGGEIDAEPAGARQRRFVRDQAVVAGAVDHARIGGAAGGRHLEGRGLRAEGDVVVRRWWRRRPGSRPRRSRRSWCRSARSADCRRRR